MTAKIIDFERTDENVGQTLDKAISDFANLMVYRRIDRQEAISWLIEAFNDAFDQHVENYRAIDEVLEEEQRKKRQTEEQP